MDYELKYVIALCLIVKITALSPECSFNGEKEKPEQSQNLLESPVAESLTSDKTSTASAYGLYRGIHFDCEPGDDKKDQVKMFKTKNDAKSQKIKENPSFDTYEHKIELLESSLKWRNIKRTLHWLDRVLSFNHSNVEQCNKRKIHVRRSNFRLKTKNNDFYQSKSKKFKNFFERKNSTRQRKLMLNVKSSIHSGKKKNFKKKRKYKLRSWINRSKNENNRKEKLKSKWKGWPRYERKHFSERNSPQLNFTTILMPKSVLFDVGKIFTKRAKNRNVNTHRCLDVKSRLESTAREIGKICGGKKKSKKAKNSLHPTKSLSGGTEARGHDFMNKQPKQKAKAWPHFVYHRVSSNFLHPDSAGHSHSQSAYVAISVATSSKPGIKSTVSPIKPGLKPCH